MKKIWLIGVLLLTLVLSGCDDINLPSGQTLPTNLTFDNITTTEETSSEISLTIEETSSEVSLTTEETTTNPVTSSEEVTTIINEEIYLQMNAGIDTVEINSDWIDAGALFVLDDIEYQMITSDSVDTSTINVYPITYEYNHNDTLYTMIRIVVVLDQTPPVLELNLGIDTLVLGSEWIDAGVIINDNSQEDITPTIEGHVDVNVPGTYEIKYTATDSSGNASSITRYVTIIE